MTSISTVPDFYLEVFFESAPDLIHRPDLKATLNHHAFLQASMAIKIGLSSCGRCSHNGFTAPPPGYLIYVKAAVSPNTKPSSLSPGDQLRLYGRFQNPVSDTFAQPQAALEEEA